MSFSQYHVEPAHIEAMRSAFHRVCEVLLLKCDNEDPMTEVIVSKIVGRPWDEAKLIGYAFAYEEATHHRRPPASTPPLGPA
jgi:hypothetical protein